MRTLADMRGRARRLVNDIREEEFADAVVNAALEEAADTLWAILADDVRGRECLRKVSSATSLVAGTSEYAVPSDSLKIRAVQYLPAGGSTWSSVEFSTEVLSETIRSGTGLLFGSPSACAGAPSWWNGLADAAGKIKLYPTPALSSGSIRFQYTFRPVFPAADADSFNLVSAVAASNPVPEGCDSAVEYRAASLLKHEELDDSKPIPYFHKLFGDKVEELKALADVCAPTTRHVRRVAG